MDHHGLKGSLPQTSPQWKSRDQVWVAIINVPDWLLACWPLASTKTPIHFSTCGKMKAPERAYCTKQAEGLCSTHPTRTILFHHQQSQPDLSSPAFLIYFPRSPLVWNMTSLHLQRFTVQMSLAKLKIFGQCCIFSKQEILPPSPSLIRLLQSIQITGLLFLRQTGLPLLA